MSTYIRSPQNPRIKQAAHLRDRRGRQRQGRIIVDGMREARRALEAGVQPFELFVCDAAQDDARLSSLLGLLSSTGAVATWVTEAVFEKVAFGNRSDAVVLVAAEPSTSLERIRLPDDALLCVLEHVEKPGNLGAVLRTADAAGVSAVIVADGGTDLYNPNAIRASLGAIFHVPVCAAPATEVLAWLKGQQLNIFAARVDGAESYTAVSYVGRAALVLGSEAAGLSDLWRGEPITAVSLPMLGRVDSLNVSATAAVLFYEALRQRQI